MANIIKEQDDAVIRQQMKTIAGSFLNDVKVDEEYAENARAVAGATTELYDRLHPSSGDALRLSRIAFCVASLDLVAHIAKFVIERFRRRA